MHSHGFRKFALAAAAAAVGAGLAGCGDQTARNGAEAGPRTIVARTPDAAAGRNLFVEKGCVICHAVNGVGGKAAPALDAQTERDAIDPVAFAARMWRGAPAMVELQGLELGYTIWLTGDEINNLAAFAADAGEQKKLTAESVPAELRDSFLDEQFWEVEDWDGFLKDGQDGAGEPEPPTDDRQ